MYKNQFFVTLLCTWWYLGSRMADPRHTVRQVPGWPLKDSLGNLGWTPLVMWPWPTNQPTEMNPDDFFILVQRLCQTSCCTQFGELHVVHWSSLGTWQLVDWSFVWNLKQNFLWLGCNLFKIFFFFNDVSGITLIAIASSAAYIHFKSNAFCNLPAILKMSPTRLLLVFSFSFAVLRNRMKQVSLRVAFSSASNTPAP